MLRCSRCRRLRDLISDAYRAGGQVARSLLLRSGDHAATWRARREGVVSWGASTAPSALSGRDRRWRADRRSAPIGTVADSG